jgi:hypothetical protein
VGNQKISLVSPHNISMRLAPLPGLAIVVFAKSPCHLSAWVLSSTLALNKWNGGNVYITPCWDRSDMPTIRASEVTPEHFVYDPEYFMVPDSLPWVPVKSVHMSDKKTVVILTDVGVKVLHPEEAVAVSVNGLDHGY